MWQPPFQVASGFPPRFVPPPGFGVPPQVIFIAQPTNAPSDKTLKLPTFWDHDPEGWLDVSMHQLGHIQNEKTKWDSLIGAFSETAAKTLRDLVTKPFIPNTGMLDLLLYEIRSRMMLSREERLHQVLHPGFAQGIKPSKQLYHLRSLLSTDLQHVVTDEVLRKSWLDSLDPSIRDPVWTFAGLSRLTNWPNSPTLCSIATR